MEEWFTSCQDYKSETALSMADGLNDASSRNVHKQKSVLEDADRFYALLQEMPPRRKAGLWRRGHSHEDHQVSAERAQGRAAEVARLAGKHRVVVDWKRLCKA